MKVTYYGQSSFHLEMNGKHLVFDPFISPNELAANINVDDIKANYILLSHGHGDHVADAEQIAKNNNASIISNFEIVSWFQGKGLNGHPMNHGGKWKFDFGTVKYVYATHSSVLPDGTNGGNPGGFVVWDSNTCFYFAGDTALTMDMKLIPLTCPKLDFAILPIGDNFTMGFDDAAIAAGFIECDTIIGCHYDTFGYIKIDHDAAKKAFAAKGKKLLLPAIGEAVEV
ncbi:MAG: metal-dependent hydrolase [Lewinellaceae bacterium]|nr:metal-dependent hydrolase [Saprospiraceae bacterium]MCB9336986.1 metal-dependent hydrolase [Lewinellaceae bacterium]